MLDDALKSEIQTAYSELLANKGFRARYCQRLMVAEIAKVLGNVEVNDEGERQNDDAVLVIEAGTGTGKTVAYLLAALPIAKALNKRLVVADRKSTRLNSSHSQQSRMPSSA